MNWITESVAIGNYLDAQDAVLLHKESVRSVLGLIRTLQDIDPAKLGVRRVVVVPLVDGAGNSQARFCQAVDALDELVREAAPVLVHCHAGRSRSAVVVAGHLMRAGKIDAEEALALIAAKRQICVTRDLLALLDGME